MATVLMLEDKGGSTTYNFLTGNLRVKMDSWRIRHTRQGDLISTWRLVGRTTDANIIVATQGIDELIEDHDLFNSNQFYAASLWLRYKATSETEKRALVKDIKFYPYPKGIFTPILGQTGVMYQMSITHGVWEDRTGASLAVQSGKTVLGGNYTQAAIAGSLPARISETRFQGQNGAGTLETIWFGIRPTRDGVSSFTPLWELEDCSTGTYSADTSQSVLVGASPNTGANNTLFCNFTTSTGWLERFAMTVDDACADTNWDHFSGSYLVILGYSTSSTGTNVAVELKTAYPNNTTARGHGVKVLTGSTTSLRMTELGEVRIPPFTFSNDLSVTRAVACKKFELQLWVKRTAGSGSFYMDFFILVPSEHLTYSTGSELQYADAKAHNIYHNVLEDEKEVIIYSDGDANLVTNLVGSFNNWHMPIEGGLAVVAACRASNIYAIGDTIGFGYAYLRRHRVHSEV